MEKQKQKQKKKCADEQSSPVISTLTGMDAGERVLYHPIKYFSRRFMMGTFPPINSNRTVVVGGKVGTVAKRCDER